MTVPEVLPTLMAGFPGPDLPAWLRDRLRAGLGGVCLFARNIASLDQLSALTDDILDANPRAIIAVDEEGGDVTRLYADVGSPYPGNAALGRLDDLALTAAVAAEVGWALRRTGCTMTFAPSVDVNANPDNPVIGVRSFGRDAELVARHGVAWIVALQATGVAATAKHFPGHGDTAQDSHIALPTVDSSLDELRRLALGPFAAAVTAGVQAVMTSHLLLPRVDPTAPATMSRRILTGILRDELGYDGVVVTDALDMAGAASTGGVAETAVRALDAGCDLLCLGNNTTDEQVSDLVAAVADAVADGTLDGGRVAQAVGRVRSLADRLTATRSSTPVPAGPPMDPLPDATLVGAFDISDAAYAWRARAGGRFAVVRLVDRPNAAVGDLPWGPDSTQRGEVVVDPSRLDAPVTVAGDGPVLVVGRDLHRHPGARQVADSLRERYDVLVADLGWPSDDRAYADVATFGASRRVGEALRWWLEGTSPRPSGTATPAPNSKVDRPWK